MSATDELASVIAGSSSESEFANDCAVAGDGDLTCTLAGVLHTDAEGRNQCPEGVARCIFPGETLALTVPVEVHAVAGTTVVNTVRVAGGGAPGPGIMETRTLISGEAAAFGVSSGGAGTALSTLQAGAHADITTNFAFNTVNTDGVTAGNLKDIVTDEPPGFALDLRAAPVCDARSFLLEDCPAATQVGVTTVDIDFVQPLIYVEPVFNLAPDKGEIAKLGFVVGGSNYYTGAITLRPPSEQGAYGGKVTFANITAGSVNVNAGSLTIWGVPAASIHDPLRAEPSPFSGRTFNHSSTATVAPFFTNPTSCTATPLTASFHVTSWQNPNESESPQPTEMDFGPIAGCDELPFEPSLETQATSASAETATGLNVNLTIPQTFANPFGLATPHLDDSRVTLPAGMTLNPSAASGLAACTEAQFAYEGSTAEPQPGEGCPPESKVGTIHVKSPVIEEEAEGALYIAQPYQNRFGSLFALYLVARIPNRGVVVTAAGKIEANPETGQLTTTFDEAAQLPFELLTFSFHQGATAPLVTPSACGAFATDSAFTPWSAPSQEHLLSSVFDITSGVDGGPCVAGGVPPFNPQAVAGTNNNDAGAFSPLYLRISRNDGEQEITGFSSQLPPGLTGDLTGIPFCGAAEIAAARVQTGAQAEEHPACPAASEIGHSIAEAGVGTVLAQAPGRLYLGGPFEGAPFSVVSVTSAKVGPFDLGTVVVHLPLDINPESAQVSIPSGPADQIPHIIDGVVVHLRAIRVYVNREHFILDPTSCAPMGLSATVIGSGTDLSAPVGQNPVTVTDAFQAADCSSLSFNPSFTASTAGHASKADGASLTFHIAYPAGAVGSESWFNYAKFDIPKQLPARLTTIQKACLAATFETDRSACPAASIIGHALVHTPILPVPLEGPVYFVSYGGAKFPDAVLVLKGYGFTIELHGHTFIKGNTGVTSATFESLPDVPFESIEVTVPTGPYSEFGANLPHGGYDFCGQSLKMPTAFKASNGLEIHQETPVTITGCKTMTRAQLLAAALKACHKHKKRSQRRACEVAARKHYASKASKNKKRK